MISVQREVIVPIGRAHDCAMLWHTASLDPALKAEVSGLQLWLYDALSRAGTRTAT
jgi:hypothetical protein